MEVAMSRVSLTIPLATAGLLLLLSFARGQTTQRETAASAERTAPAAAAQQSNELHDLIQQPSGQPGSVLLFARSDTVYMKSETVRSWLRRQPEFSELRLAFAADQRHADYYIEVTRPVFTWDWTYCVVKTRSGKVVTSGKVTAATAELAAKKMAPKLIQALYVDASAKQMAQASGSFPETPPGEIRPKRFLDSEQMARIFESSKTYSVQSSTVWFNTEFLTTALKQRPEFEAWGYQVAERDSLDSLLTTPPADLAIIVNRPLFTWDWTFSIDDVKTKRRLAEGKVTAISDAAAAPKLARAIAAVIANSRGLPSEMHRQIKQALEETKVRTWRVRHISGQEYLKSGKDVQLAVGERTVFARDGEEILFSAPVEDLLQFYYSSNRRDRSVKWFEDWEKAGNFVVSGVGDDPRAAAGALAVMLPMLAVEYGVGGMLKGSMATDYFLTLNWKALGGVSTATFQGDEKDIREISTELDKFSKQPAVDLDAAAQKALSDFDQQLKTTDYFIETDRNVRLNDRNLPPGKYRVVILRRENNLAEVYFLRGQDSAIAAQTIVQYAPRSNADRSSRATYDNVLGLETFQEIQIDEHTLTFSAVPVFPDEV